MNSIFIIGVIIIIFLFIREPLIILKAFLRYLKSLEIPMVLLTAIIWGPFWVLDRVFKLKIFFEDLSETSTLIEIKFDLMEKYLILDSVDEKRTLLLIRKVFIEESLGSEETKLSIAVSDKIYLRVESISREDFRVLFNLSEFFYSERTLDMKAVFMHRSDSKKSFYLMASSDYPDKLVGRTYKRRKIYFSLKEGNSFYLNPNLNYVKSFNFNKFRDEKGGLRFQKVEL